ncbi:MAG: FG-GAP-like repeat-containing protein, partial [Candidatus Eiseniibacteriota bacterium]
YVTAVDGSGNESVASAEIQGWTTQVQVPGWPQATGSFNYPGITMADANHDDTQEIYIGSHDFDFHGWNFDAAPLPGFPLSTAFEIWSTAGVADLNHDGNDELLFGGRDSRFYVIENDGSPFFGATHWIVDLPGSGEEIRTAATVADVDSDGQLEFLFGSDLGNVYAFNHDGTGLTGPTGLLYSALPADLGSRIWGTVAVADLEGDGPQDIVFASWNNSLYAITAAGALKPGFPRTELDDFRSGAALGDLDDDGTLEIIAGNFDGNLYAYNHDGSDYVSGAILASIGFRIGATPSLANVDADPELEIFVGGLNGKLYAYNHDGSSFLAGQGGLFADLPLGAGPNEGISASAIIVDVDGDSDFEIFVGHRNTNFYGFHHDGSTVIGLPIPTGDFIFSTAAAGDLDGDGSVDVAFASYDASVNVLDFTGPSTPAAYEWATYGGNNGRTAAYGDPGPQAVTAPSNAATTFELALLPNAPNPFAGATTIQYMMPSARAAKLQVFDISGRLVRTLVDGSAAAGANVVRWDGRDAGGEILSSGVYFFRLHDGDRTVTRKAVLLR